MSRARETLSSAAAIPASDLATPAALRLSVRTRRARRRPALSLATKLAILLIVFLAVPAILYDVFREADETKNALLLRSAQEEGRLISLGLQPMLSGPEAPSPDLADALSAFGAEGRSVRVMFRPSDNPEAGFFYIAAYPPLPPAILQQERDQLDRQGILGRLAGTCALDSPTAVRQHNPDGMEEVISAIIPTRTAAGCWVVVVSHTGGALVSSSIGRPYWQTPEVRIAGAIYLVLAAVVISIFVRVWRNLKRFSSLAGEIRRRNSRAGSFSDQNSVPELVEVAAAIDDMVAELGKLSHAVERSASAVLIFDARGRTEYANPAAIALTGYASADLIGRSCRHLRGPGTSVSAFMQALRTASHGGTWRGEFSGRRKSGEAYWALASVAPSSNGAIRPSHYVAVLEDITDRMRSERQKSLLMAELNHRVKNTLATVRSIASQTAGEGGSPEGFRKAFAGRLAALAQAHELLVRTNWEGADLRSVVERTLAPFGRADGAAWQLRGPAVTLQPKQALALTLALHELATNAAKYGALSTRAGKIAIEWMVERQGGNERLRLQWVESGGPRVAPPTHRGFGTRLIEGGIPYDLDGEAQIEFQPDGVRCVVMLPWPGVETNAAEAAIA